MGRFTLRLPDTLHKELAALAKREGISLNLYLVYALTRQVMLASTLQADLEHEFRQRHAAIEEVLQSFGQPSLDEFGAMSQGFGPAGPETG